MTVLYAINTKLNPHLYYYLLTSFIPVKGIWDCLYSDTEWFIFP